MRVTAALGAVCAMIVGVVTGTGEAKTKPPNPHGIEVTRDIGLDKAFTSKEFPDAKCSISQGTFNAVATGEYGAKFIVQVRPFQGFGRYALEAGTTTGPYVSTFAEFLGANNEGFSSNYVPPYKVPSLGAIQFGDGGRLLGVGFMPLFNASGSEALIVTGVTVCHYTKTKTKTKK